MTHVVSNDSFFDSDYKAGGRVSVRSQSVEYWFIFLAGSSWPYAQSSGRQECATGI